MDLSATTRTGNDARRRAAAHTCSGATAGAACAGHAQHSVSANGGYRSGIAVPITLIPDDLLLVHFWIPTFRLNQLEQRVNELSREVHRRPPSGKGVYDAYFGEEDVPPVPRARGTRLGLV